ncbi:MAG: FAD-dependent oxidoreductase [Proteobacteria bacterium]|nr:FAD-dependent oxidoreductase [Pseudomonadota bacterium]
MTRRVRVDICVIGAGSGGLSVAAGASRMGAETVLVEQGKMGGDCLNYGCVPSKSMLAAAHAAERVRGSGRFGVDTPEPDIDFAGVHRHVHEVIAGIAPHDSVERFEGLGVRVIQAHARFVAADAIEAGDVTVEARRFVVATGSRPMAPPIPGLDGVPFLTNETVFDATRAPEHLIVIGGGPVGAELSQAHRRLGARVTMLEMFTMLGNDDPELVAVVRDRLSAEGVDIHEGAKVVRVEARGDGVAVTVDSQGAERRIEGSHLLVAAGRSPNVDDLGLETAGIAHGATGIEVDARLRTTNKRVFAIGDVTGAYPFTHMANYHAGIVIRNALFRLPAKVDYRAVPWVTFTDPELAQVGVTEARARQAGGEIRVLRWPFAENDRARAERETQGLVKVVTTPRGRILGAGIVGASAGELIQTWELALRRKLNIGAMADLITAYPTLAEASKRAAGSFYTPKLFSERTRWLVRFLARFG